MCGVFALFLRRPLTERDVVVGREGTASLAHRGPNNGGEWLDRRAGVYLGHRRLSIIDLSASSNQPLARDSHVISYNGEAYNFPELRARLEGLGARFTTTGDTEVLLEAWRHFGPASLDVIDGMFAFALWDGEVGWLAVDRFGEKSLYLADTPDGLYVSSELRTLVKLLGPETNDRWLLPFLSTGSVLAPDTAYRNITRIPPGTILKVARGRIVSRQRYWTPPRGEPGRGKIHPLTESQLDRIQETLADSLRARLAGDVRSCIFLSGGVDSSLIAAMMARDLGQTPDCLTVSFPTGATHDEAAASRWVAAALGLPHSVVVAADNEYREPARYQFGMFGQPSDNITVGAAEQMGAVAVAQGCTFGIAGVGADEVFYGYMKHQLLFARRFFLNLPESLRLALTTASAPVSWASSKVTAFRGVCGVPDAERYLAVKNMPGYDMLRRVPGVQEWAQLEYGAAIEPIEYAVPRYDLERGMPNSQLVAADVGFMRASFEMRTPFLSAKLVELVATFDPRSLLAFGQKSTLRRLLARYLPERRNDQKRGFSAPPDQFLAHYHAVPEVHGVPPQVAEAIWRRRDESRGCRQIAVRLVLASELPAWLSEMRRSAGPRLSAVGQVA